MKLFSCNVCGNVLYFENRICGRCGSQLGYAPKDRELLTLSSGNQAGLSSNGGAETRLCANAEQDACNWLVSNLDESFCLACRHNGTVPNLSIPENPRRWRELEVAKHRLFYSLLRWNLPLRTRREDPQHGLIFNFLADAPAATVMTGHENGIITIALAEADDSERERRRQDMGEPYRTLLGHFRHEVGHHYWDLLVRDSSQLSACRALFGDDGTDYQHALDCHYRDGPPADWRQSHVSAYAASHPWEDFAETWAHYIHIVDTLEMANNFGIQVRPMADRTGALSVQIDFDPYEVAEFDRILDAWLPFVFAMNSVSRAIGARDMYPFILAPAVIEKLRFVHGLIRHGRKG